MFVSLLYPSLVGSRRFVAEKCGGLLSALRPVGVGHGLVNEHPGRRDVGVDVVRLEGQDLAIPPAAARHHEEEGPVERPTVLEDAAYVVAVDASLIGLGFCPTASQRERLPELEVTEFLFVTAHKELDGIEG